MDFQKKYTVLISPQVRFVIDSESIQRDELGLMLERAALTTHDRGNRRYHQWIFNTKTDLDTNTLTVDFMTAYEIPTQKRVSTQDKDFVVFDEHEDCDGFGCKGCGYTGEIRYQYLSGKKPSHYH
jgi:hypothetical protein